MSTFSGRFYVRILATFLAFLLVYAPLVPAPQLAASLAYAQGADGDAVGGNSNSSGNNAAIDNAGIDSQGNLDSGAFGINAEGQVVDSEGQVVDLNSGWNSFGSFLATIFDIVIAFSPIGIAVTVVNVVANAVTGTNTTAGEKIGAALGFSSATSAVGAVSRDVMGVLGIDLSKTASDIVDAFSSAQVNEVQISTDGTVAVDGRLGENTLDKEGLADWGSYVERENNGYANEGQSQSVSLGASAAEVERGGEVTLTWSSEAGSTCITQGYGWTGREDSSGNAIIRDIQTDQVFLLQCTHTFETFSGGGDNAQPALEKRVGLAQTAVRVRDGGTATSTDSGPQTAPGEPAPAQSASHSGQTVQGLSLRVSGLVGGQTTLSWSADGNRSCRFEGPWPGSSAERAAASGRDASAVSRVYNLFQPTTFTIGCVGLDGVSRSVSATAR